jgi:hypothetical protein
MDVLGTTPPVERAAQLEPTRSLPVRRVDATHSLSVTVGEAVIWRTLSYLVPALALLAAA